MARKVVIAAAILVGLVVAYVTLFPVPIDPVAWHPLPPPPMRGPLAPNSALSGAGHLLADVGEGPEDSVTASSSWTYSSIVAMAV
jgi:hypothetical protein